MIRYRAEWVLPIGAPPIRGGIIAIDGDRVAAVSSSTPARTAGAIDLGRVAVLPGLVNAHTHLALSYLRGQIAPAQAFVQWLPRIIATRRHQPGPGHPQNLRGVGAPTP